MQDWVSLFDLYLIFEEFLLFEIIYFWFILGLINYWIDPKDINYYNYYYIVYYLLNRVYLISILYIFVYKTYNSNS